MAFTITYRMRCTRCGFYHHPDEVVDFSTSTARDKRTERICLDCIEELHLLAKEKRAA